jgi:outer membrane lipoprotein-sorting protein
MLKKLVVIAALAFLTPALLAQTVDEIVAKTVEARGGMDKLKSVKSIKSTGKMELGPGMEAPGVMWQMRPDMVRLEFTLQGMTAVQAYDGASAWMIMPFTGKKDPEAMTADDTKELQEDADIDGPLVDYKSKGNTVELLGKDKLEGTDAYKVKVTLKNGDIKTIYLDSDSYLEIKEEGKRTVRGSEQEFESSLSDYREVNGIMFPFAVESGVKGSQQKQKLTIDKIELNVPVEPATFKMPPAAVTPPAKPTTSKPEDKKEPPKN